ncbi:hypothetical protein [Methanobrevibacter curvatus]|uniref:Uncharacterized protein n=1 Tax=Methanobrevibacter curvatus TaxID=49547 RepID=A0A166CFQ0_9EURY|nr:hypothetical protein [Methanobrevibacter curvatus]KZX14456.1 hypothetical protein MBCUR_04620 [Methanobrevibacter curvatus]
MVDENNIEEKVNASADSNANVNTIPDNNINNNANNGSVKWLPPERMK